MTCESCGEKPKKCDKDFTKAVIEINNPEQITLMRRVVVPASMGDDTTVPPVVGKYKNVLLFYEANSKSYLYSSDGIPTLLANGLTDYEQAVNLPQINGVTLTGDKTATQLGLQDKLTAGANISIDADNVISAVDTTYGPATDSTIGLVKPGAGLEVDTDGTLSISDIEQYAHFFDTVADMKAATNLKGGDYAKTLGFYSANDGGSALYKISDTGTANEMDVIAIGDTLYASLIDGETVKQYGAYGDGTHDDINVFNYVLTLKNSIKTDNSEYLIGTPLLITNSKARLDIKGTIIYNGSDYAIVTSNNNLDIYVYSIKSANGGIEIANGTNYSKITVDYIDSYLHSMYVLASGTNGIVTINDFYGVRWIEHTNECLMIENTVTTGSGWNTENRFHNVALDSWNDSGKYNLYLRNANNNSETQALFFECDLENGKGIKTYGRVSMVSLNNCRVQEMFTKQDCIYIENYMPTMEILGLGTIDPSLFHFENVTTALTNRIVTNLSFKDHTTNSFYFGGGYIYNDHFVPFVKQRNGAFRNIAATELDDNNVITLTLNNSGGIYGQFISAVTGVNYTIKVPDYFGEVMNGSMMLQCNDTGHSITISNTSNNSITFTPSGFEKNMIFFEGSRPVGRVKIG